MAQTLQNVHVIGSLDPSVRTSLASDVALVADAGRADALLVDGSVTAIDAERVKSSLDAAKPVVILQPTDAQLAMLGELTGGRLVGKLGAVAVARDPSGFYRAATSPIGEVKAVDNVEGGELIAPSPSAPSVAQLLSSVAPPTPLLGASDVGLLPPEGATFGQATYVVPVSLNIGQVPPGVYNYGSKIQALQTSIIYNFYVYWVDGQGTPYYLVLMRQDLNMGVGQIVANEEHARGWWQYLAWTSVASVGSGSRVSLLGTSPSAGDNTSGVNVEVYLKQNVPGGTGSQKFTVAHGVQLSLPGWTVENVTQLPTALPAWHFHQTTPWDPSTQPLTTWNYFYKGTTSKPAAEQLKPLPAISTSQLVTSVYAWWKVEGPRGARFSATFDTRQDFIFLVTPPGANTGQYGLWGICAYPIAYGVNLDLGTLAQPVGQ
jgi:hypothetical protein